MNSIGVVTATRKAGMAFTGKNPHWIFSAFAAVNATTCSTCATPAEKIARRGTGLPAIDKNGKQIGLISNLDGLTVVRDDDPDPNRRYKLIAHMQDHRISLPIRGFYRRRSVE